MAKAPILAATRVAGVASGLAAPYQGVIELALARALDPVAGGGGGRSRPTDQPPREPE